MGKTSDPVPAGEGLFPPHTRIALPENGLYEIIDVVEESFPAFSQRVTSLVSEALRSREMAVPAIALREVVDNLVHAVPCTASVVLSPSCRNVYISDTGSGMSRPDLAFELGYSTADALRRSYIRGVGIGLYLARRDLQSLGGELHIASGPGGGTYVNMALAGSMAAQGWEDEAALCLTQRQNNILFLLSEGESLGPSGIAGELNIGVSTAHRDLVKLQDLGLIFLTNNGKRSLSNSGRSYLQGLLSL